MKNYLAAVIVTALFFSACNNNEEAERRHQKTLDSINSELTMRDSTINDYLRSFNEIEENLDSVQTQQEMLSMDIRSQKGDVKENVKERINLMIIAINGLIEQNKLKIADLNAKLKRNVLRIGEFQKMIAGLNDQINEKNASLQSLNDQLTAANAQVAQLQTSIDTLTNDKNVQAQTIAVQTAVLHTAYYVVGKTKDLEKMEVIDKKGGLLGIGKTAQLNSDFNKNDFTQIDYTQTMNIPINSKKAKLVTSHPTDSYVLEKDNDDKYTNLHITEPVKFWAASKYLVVAVN